MPASILSQSSTFWESPFDSAKPNQTLAIYEKGIHHDRNGERGLLQHAAIERHRVLYCMRLLARMIAKRTTMTSENLLKLDISHGSA